MKRSSSTGVRIPEKKIVDSISKTAPTKKPLDANYVICGVRFY